MIEDIKSGTKIFFNFSQSTYFGWEGGSSLIFWRWHPNLKHVAKYGFPPLITSTLPRSKKTARRPMAGIYKKIVEKVVKSISRNYLILIESKQAKNLIDYFAVPKAHDIRLVLNGSSCGLNSAVWAPNFWLPTSSSMTRVLNYNYKSVDIDLGELFLNFPLDPKLTNYSVMDVSHLRNEIKQNLPHLQLPDPTRLLVANTRSWMGFRPSPE